jgi:predicted DNA-binding transcriptional regulator AlpA
MTDKDQQVTPLLDDQQLAEILGVSPKTIANWRCSKRLAIPYIKLSRSVRYRKADIAAYLATRTVNAMKEEDGE